MGEEIVPLLLLGQRINLILLTFEFFSTLLEKRESNLSIQRLLTENVL